MIDYTRDIQEKVESLSVGEKNELFRYLRKDQIIHPLEIEFGAPAEVILEAISRSSDLTKRGVRGIIAEASFKVEVLSKEPSIKILEIDKDEPYDFMIEYNGKRVSIQVKMQRLKDKRPMMANEGYRILPKDCYVVETQRTRGGKDKDGGETRPYRFGEFDILAVSMQPSSRNWKDFRYSLGNWLLPRLENDKLLLKFQPVPIQGNPAWTSDLKTVLDWHISGIKNPLG